MIKRRNRDIRRINERITSEKVRLINERGENDGIVSTKEALTKAINLDLDLVEISDKAVPPIARIVDYGKFKYDEKKKNKGVKKPSASQTKNTQIKMTTSEDAVTTRIGLVNKWLKAGHRVRVDLFLFGRYKGMEESFLKKRLQGFIDRLESDYKILDDIRRSPKGFSISIQGKEQKDEDK